MKKMLLYFLLYFSITSMFAQSPLVISKQNFNAVLKNDTLAFLSAELLPKIEIPQAGTNMVWDFSKYSILGQEYSINRFMLPTDSFFENADIKGLDYWEALASDRGFNFDEYQVLADNGYKTIGCSILQQEYSIGDLTGDPSDKIVFAEQNQLYDSPRFILPFPLEFGSAKESNFTKSANFYLTIAIPGISNTTFRKVAHISQKDTVIGWGTIYVPNIFAPNGKSAAYNTLLVKRVTMVADSFYLGDSPAPPALLSAFSLSQGELTYTNRYIFWSEKTKSPIASISFDDEFSAITNFVYNVNTDYPTSVENDVAVSNNLFVYPNPVNNRINLNFDHLINQIIRITITDEIGNIVLSNEINTADASLELPNHIGNGTYIVSIYNLSGKLINTGKFIVSK